MLKVLILKHPEIQAMQKENGHILLELVHMLKA